MPKKNKITKSSLPVSENVAGALSYLLGWLTGIIFYILGKDSKFIRFHAMQSIIFFVLINIVSFIISSFTFSSLMTSGFNNPIGYMAALGPTSIALTISSLINLITLVVWILCMYKAYKGEKFKLPFIGDLAEKYSS